MYGYFAKWQHDGIFTQLSGLLRALVRTQQGRDPEPTACILDSQTIKTSANVPLSQQAQTQANASSAANAISAPTPSACC